MTALIDEYKTELEDILCFAQDTVENYLSCILKFYEYSRNRFQISPDKATGSHIRQWITELKGTGISYSRLQHHQSALKTFFAMLVKLKIVDQNPADALPPMIKRGTSKVRPVPRTTVFKLLRIVDQSNWFGMRNFMIISILWALGLRISELTGLKIGSFEPGIDPKQKIGLLRVKGKNRKERALFVVDKLYENLMVYLTHPETLKGKKIPFSCPKRQGHLQ